MAEILSIPRQVLHQEVAVRLRQRIVEGHIAPGAKLNLDSMDPSLIYLDGASGTIASSLRLPPELHQLSLRHLAVAADDTVAVAMQYEGPSDDLVPLVALHRPGAPALTLLSAPAETLRGMRNYCGSTALDAAGTTLAVSCPKGNRIVLWDWTTLQPASFAVADGCGVAAAGGPGHGRTVSTHGTGSGQHLTRNSRSVRRATGRRRP